MACQLFLKGVTTNVEELLQPVDSPAFDHHPIKLVLFEIDALEDF